MNFDLKDITQLIVAITGLLVALGALGVGCHNGSRLDQHKGQIETTAAKVEANTEQIDKTEKKVEALK